MRTLMVMLALLLTVSTAAAAGGDYDREKKWADEILPGVVVGDPVWLEAEGRRFLGLHTPGKGRGSVVLIHGIGVHPDWGLIGTLRTRLADAGYTTLSIQMPVLTADAKADAYPPTFPEATARIATAVRRLHGETPVAVVAHSLGARMANEYFSGVSGGATAYVAIGLSVPWPEGLQAGLPILDIYGSADLPQVLEAAAHRKASTPSPSRIRQARIAGADHFFVGAEMELVEAIKGFLEQTMPRR